jgi:aquaporin Z
MSTAGKLTAEAIGTFALCFIGAGSICLTTWQGSSGPGLLGVAMAHGIILAIAVSATMNTSGGHLNPAVTIAMLTTRRIGAGDAIAYILAQILGAMLAGVLVFIIFDGISTGQGSRVVASASLGTPSYDPDSITMGKAVLVEAMLTFLLVFAIFGTAVDPRAPKIGGFGIGLTIAADILMGGPLTGAAMNPARTFGPGVVAWNRGLMDQFWTQHWVYWVGPVAGAVLAAFIYDGLIMDKRPASSLPPTTA